MKYIGDTTKTAFKEMIEADKLKAWDTIKDDWYGLDQLYNRAHPENLFWQVVQKPPNSASHLPFVNERSLHHQLAHIRDFLRKPSSRFFFIERKYPYLKETNMSRVVNDTVQATLHILYELEHKGAAYHLQSSTEMLSHEMMHPYSMPLGDI